MFVVLWSDVETLTHITGPFESAAEARAWIDCGPECFFGEVFLLLDPSE